jgi:hypothetical protein
LFTLSQHQLTSVLCSFRVGVHYCTCTAWKFQNISVRCTIWLLLRSTTCVQRCCFALCTMLTSLLSSQVNQRTCKHLKEYLGERTAAQLHAVLNQPWVQALSSITTERATLAALVRFSFLIVPRGRRGCASVDAGAGSGKKPLKSVKVAAPKVLLANKWCGFCFLFAFSLT